MKIDCRELFPIEISDEAAYYLVDFFYNLALTFEGLHMTHVMRHEKAIIDGKVKPKRNLTKSKSGEKS
jgi:hypothetical protein